LLQKEKDVRKSKHFTIQKKLLNGKDSIPYSRNLSLRAP
jgi:hypothetical protein